jgi:hypothetical protein
MVWAKVGFSLVLALAIPGPALAQDAEPVRFGYLRITARTCTKTPPTELPEVTAFLEVQEVQPGVLPVLVFSGWMFASSPALSAMEHAVYDVWVIDCRAATIALPGAAAANP